MPLSTALNRISTNVRFLTGSLLRPESAAALAERLFLTPPKTKLPQSTFFDFLDARASFVEHRGRNLASWRTASQKAGSPGCPISRAHSPRSPRTMATCAT